MLDRLRADYIAISKIVLDYEQAPPRDLSPGSKIVYEIYMRMLLDVINLLRSWIDYYSGYGD